MPTLKLSPSTLEDGGPRTKRRRRRRGALPAKRPQVARVRVSGGYVPDVIHVRSGEPVTIVFRRDEAAPCSERVVFPALGRTATLPIGQDIAVEIAPLHSGQYEFTCAMNILRGRLIVHEGDPR